MPESGSVKNELWHYTPSIIGGIIGAAVFAVLLCLHAYRLVRNKTWFCTPFVVGGLFEVIGYAARAVAHNDTDSLTPYIIQSLLILIAPILFAASIYMVLGRLMLRTDSASLSLIRPQWVTRIFVAGDIWCFMIQSGGAGILAKADTPNDVNRGEIIILGGLILQILIFAVFIVVASIWHFRLSASGADEMQRGVIPWRRYIALLYVASSCITVRNIYRVIEYGMGNVRW
ncbi:hypothetical protein EJ04DRAFT_171143 [Polyplosphaeria fusca]|uniref:RTA1 like protein n=1 Tax=Polyplosphaeria fusca TaxID=682080 RepID=A0A9P4V1H2_9PLEO|nr:hypothetical protein EJ04DRAFT_171143 [Polyplosphaeria fusca]